MSRRLQKKIIRQAQQRQSRQMVETRDGILWDVLPSQRIARVKIQGSSTFVIAHYPENWEQTPAWLKQGNPVRINHRGGQRQRVELIGHGQVLPTFYDGTAQAPTTPAGADAIVTGFKVYATAPASMSIYVMEGSWRINGVTYTVALGNLVMSETSNLLMDEDSDLVMSEVEYAHIATIGATPAAGYWRYDALVIGTDGVIDTVAGTPFNAASAQAVAKTEELYPETPENHVRIAVVLVVGGATAITQDNVNKKWYVPIPSSFETTAYTLRYPTAVTMDGHDYVYEDYSNADYLPDGPFQSALIEMTIKDQYGEPYIPLSGEQIIVSIANATGNGVSNDYGQLSSEDDKTVYGSSAIIPLKSDGTVTFRWAAILPQESTLDRHSPRIHATVMGKDTVYGELFIWWLGVGETYLP